MTLTTAIYIINNIASDVFVDDERDRAIMEYLKTHLQSDVAEKIINYLFNTKREGCKI